LTAPAEIVAVVLAAGRSIRFGGDKLLQPWRGKPLAAHIASTVSALPVTYRIAICPAGEESRAAIFSREAFEIVANDDPAAGMGHSLALGARRAMALDASAMLLCLADMPGVTRDHLQRLINAGATADAVVTEAAGTRTPPAIFSRTLLPQLAAFTGDKGARDLIRDAALVIASPEIVRDFDRPGDFS
jgi:molybdenum cofactor cytidylyltransferase